MTPREEFKDDLVNTVIHCLLFNEIKGKINFPDDVLERFTKVWAPKDEWISIEEELPETGQIVFVCDALEGLSTLGRLNSDGEMEWLFIDQDLDRLNADCLATHWMPLPKFPEIEDKHD